MSHSLTGTSIALIILCIIAVSADAAFEDIGLGARSLGMGSAFVAAAEGASAIFWNPAGVVRVDGRELTMSYVELYSLVSYSHLGYAHRMNMGSIGLGLISSSDVDGVYREITLALSAAGEVYPDLIVGANVKYLSSAADTGDIRIGNGRGLALDLGCQYHAWNDLVSLGVAFQNPISRVWYNRETVKDIPGQKYSQKLDLSYRIGASVHLGGLLSRAQGSVLAADFSDGDIYIGAEHIFRDMVAARAGFRTGDALTRSITAGFGLELSAFRLDYAYVGSEFGAQTSQFSISIEW